MRGLGGGVVVFLETKRGRHGTLLTNPGGHFTLRSSVTVDNLKVMRASPGDGSSRIEEKNNLKMREWATSGHSDVASTKHSVWGKMEPLTLKATK